MREQLSANNRHVRAVIQRVERAAVVVEGATVGSCGRGLLVLVGIARNDSHDDAVRLAGKVARLRVFANDGGRFDQSLIEIGGEALVVSQFTLIADTARGNRPSFSSAAPPALAQPIYEQFCDALRQEGISVSTGVFGARMAVELVNEGPVTVVLDL